MKRIVIVVCANILMAVNCYSQSDEKGNYLQKSKNKKILAWSLLGGGAVVDIIGIVSFPKGYNIFGNTGSTESKANTSFTVIGIGTLSMLASIPFFISAHKNKKKALTVSIDTQQLQQLKNNNRYAVNYPAITMKIRL
jgi:hypothetical protein